MYRIFNEDISRVTVKMFLNHLWYLIEELVIVALAFTLETKEKIVHAMTKITKEEHPLKRAIIDPCDIQKKCLHDFAPTTQNLFQDHWNISHFSK